MMVESTMMSATATLMKTSPNHLARSFCRTVFLEAFTAHPFTESSAS
jgi:hypothetical protein